MIDDKRTDYDQLTVGEAKTNLSTKSIQQQSTAINNHGQNSCTLATTTKRQHSYTYIRWTTI